MALTTHTECPTCGLQVDPGTDSCPRDGTPLSDSDKTVRSNINDIMSSAGPGTSGTVRRHVEDLSPSMSGTVRRPVPEPFGQEEDEEGTLRSDPLIGMRLGEYVVKERVGVGGMGIVYRGEQPMIGKQVAIKVLRPEVNQPTNVERLLAEARVVNAIRHRGIIDIFSFGQTPNGQQYFVMEYLEGSALDFYINERGVLSPREAIRLSDEMLDALSAAHHAGVIHRDLKPHNIFLVRQPGGGTYVKVLDFGLAKETANPKGPQGLTQQGYVVGTPEYMAPEQVRGEPVTPKTDLYAFGVVLFQMLTGQLPFTARATMEYLARHLDTPPPSPLTVRPELPPALAELVLRLLAKSPEERPTVEETRDELREIALTLPPEPVAPRAPTRNRMAPAAPPVLVPVPSQAVPTGEVMAKAQQPTRSRTVLGIALAGGALLAAGAGVLVLRRQPEPPPAPPAVAAATAQPSAPNPRTPAEAQPAAPAEPTAATPTPTASPTEPAQAANPPASPIPAAPPEQPVEPRPVVRRTPTSSPKPPRNTAPAGSETSPQALLQRIARLQKQLDSVAEEDRQQALEILDKARDKARAASTPDERKKVSENLDTWERRYLGG